MAESKIDLDAKIVLALEKTPRVAIPAGFAARVIAHLPAHTTAVVTPARYGYRAAAACLFVLFALMLGFARHATGPSLLSISIEWIFYVQFATLAVWLAARSAGYTLSSTF